MISKVLRDNYVILCLIVIIVMLYNNKALCMDNEYFFNETCYASYDNMIRAKQNIFYKALVFEDIGFGNRSIMEIKQIFNEIYNHNDRINFNILLNKNDTPQQIALFAKNYIKYL